MQVVVKILGKTNLRSAQLEKLATISHLEVFDTNVPNRSTAEVVSRAADAEVILVNGFTPITEQVIASLPTLRHIVSCSAGIDHVDLAACRRAGIEVRWFPGYCARTLAEKTLCFILMGINQILPALSVLEIEQVMFIPREHLSFTIWYLKSKRFVAQDDRSSLMITAEGIDFLETHLPEHKTMHKMLEAAEMGETRSQLAVTTENGAH